MKPVCLVDQDGPLADFDKAFYDFCIMHDVEMHSTYETQCHRFATDCILDDINRRWARTVVDTNPRWFHDLPVRDGAVEGINRLTEHFDVWICTKPLEANRTCRDGKAEWVRTHLGKDWESRLIITPDKSMVRGAVLLDDAPKHVWFGRASWNPVIYPTTWNGEGSEWDRLPRWSWADPVEQLLELASSTRRLSEADLRRVDL